MSGRLKKSKSPPRVCKKRRHQGGAPEGLFSAENFLEERGVLGGGGGADFYFFLAECVEEAVEGFADDVLVEIELIGDGPAAGGGFDDLVILLEYADALQGGVDDGGERGGEIGGAGLPEVFGGGGVAAGEDMAGVGKGHLLEGVEENLFGLGRGALGGAVHADFEVVHGIAFAEQAHGLADGLKFRGKKDANGFVIQESVGLAGERDGFAGGEFEGLLEAGNDPVVAEGGGVMGIGRCVGLLAIFVELGCGTGAEGEC